MLDCLQFTNCSALRSISAESATSCLEFNCKINDFCKKKNICKCMSYCYCVMHDVNVRIKILTFGVEYTVFILDGIANIYEVINTFLKVTHLL